MRRSWWLNLFLAGVLMSGLAAPAAATAREERERRSSAAKPFDFNGDGYADLAAGVPGESIGEVEGAGAIEVIYGGRRGLTSSGSQFWSQASPGVKGTPDFYRFLGDEIGSGDFDGDGYADLAATVRARVAILYGSSHGLTSRDQYLSGEDFGRKNDFGEASSVALAVGDFNGDGYSDLAAADPLVTLSSADYAGAVVVLSGSPKGLTTTGRLEITKASDGVAGDPEDGDGFGTRLGAGDVSGDGRDDLFVWNPNVSGLLPEAPTDQGIYSFLGSPTGLRTMGSTFLSRESEDVRPADTYLSIGFGEAFAAGDFDGDGFGDLAVGDQGGGSVSGLCQPDSPCPGVVVVFPGSAKGPTTDGREVWSLAAPDFPGRPQNYQDFGATLAAGDLNGDHRADLAVGAPLRMVGTVSGAGAVSVIYGSRAGLSSSGRQLWTQDSAGIKGVATSFDQFGGGPIRILNFGKGRQADLAIHTPDDTDSDFGSVNVLYGSRSGVSTTDQSWDQNVPGVPGTSEVGDHFGGHR